MQLLGKNKIMLNPFVSNTEMIIVCCTKNVFTISQLVDFDVVGGIKSKLTLHLVGGSLGKYEDDLYFQLPTFLS